MNRLNGGFYAYKRGIMSNNRVEVHVGAKTSELKKVWMMLKRLFLIPLSKLRIPLKG